MDGSGSGTADRVDRAGLSRRWRQEGRYEEIAEFRQQVKEVTKKAWRSAGCQWDRDELNEVAWQEAARAFPPLDTERVPGTDSQSESAHCGRVTGLGDIPASWPDLPNNASLQSELNWVQANRLVVVEERPSGATRVHLGRARSPAPNLAAIGWLETSIRAYSKYVDIVAKALKDEVDEQADVRRERLGATGNSTAWGRRAVGPTTGFPLYGVHLDPFKIGKERLATAWFAKEPSSHDVSDRRSLRLGTIPAR